MSCHSCVFLLSLAIIEHVRDGSVVRALLLPDYYLVTIMLSGVKVGLITCRQNFTHFHNNGHYWVPFFCLVICLSDTVTTCLSCCCLFLKTCMCIFSARHLSERQMAQRPQSHLLLRPSSSPSHVSFRGMSRLSWSPAPIK